MTDTAVVRADDPRTFRLRCAVGLAGLLGFVALAGGGLLSIPTAGLAGAAYVAASYAPIALPERRQLALRKAASVSVLLIVAAAAALRAVSGLAGGEAVIGIGTTLAVLVSGLQVAHALLLDARRDLAVGLTIGAFTIVLAAGLVPGPGILVPLVAAWPTVIVAAILAHRLEQVGSVVATAASPAGSRRGAVGPTAAIVAAAMAAGLAVFLVLPQPTGIHPHGFGTGGSATSDGSGGIPVSRDAFYYSGGVMDLRARGALGNQPVALVPASSPLLWSDTVLSTYDGQTWSNDQSTPVREVGGPTYAIPHPLYPSMAGPTRTDRVEVQHGFTGVVIAPGAVDSITTSGSILLAGGGSVVLAPAADGQLPSYSVTSTPAVVDPAALQQSAGPDQTDPVWLQLPNELPTRVVDLARQITAGATNRYQAVRSVEDYLRSHETYRLDSPLPAPGADAVDDFLFVSHTGFCEQFASAEVVLLRAVGIPTRLVSGFGYGTPDGTGTRLFRVSDAHAWAEVWYPGDGWSPSDPTAGARLASTGTGTTGPLRALLQQLSSSGNRLLLAIGILVAAGAVLVLARRRRRPKPGAPRTGELPPLRAAFARLESALASAGVPRTPAESVSDVRDRLTASTAAWTPTAAPTATSRMAFDTLERDLYAPVPPRPAAQLDAARELERLAADLVQVPPDQ